MNSPSCLYILWLVPNTCGFSVTSWDIHCSVCDIHWQYNGIHWQCWVTNLLLPSSTGNITRQEESGILSHISMSPKKTGILRTKRQCFVHCSTNYKFNNSCVNFCEARNLFSQVKSHSWKLKPRNFVVHVWSEKTMFQSFLPGTIFIAANSSVSSIAISLLNNSRHSLNF